MMKKLREQMKWIMVIIVVAFLLSTFLMYEGRSGRRSPGRNPDGTMADYEVAQINGRALMRSELERGLSAVFDNLGRQNTVSMDMPTLYQAVLDQYVLESQVAREVEERGISVSDAEAEQAMKDYADRYYPTREAFYQTLQAAGIKRDEYRKDIARQMASQRLFQSVIGDIDVSDEQAVKFYDTMKDMFYHVPEGFRVHLASYNNKAGADAMRERLTSGKSWADAAADDKMKDADASNITQEPVFLPTTALTGMFAPLASLDVGVVSPVFQISSDDYAVGMKVEHVMESIRDYNSVSADVKLVLREQETRQRLANFQKELMDKAQIVIHDASLFPQRQAEPNDAEAVNPDPAAEPVTPSPEAAAK